jgi:hypothetical protein
MLRYISIFFLLTTAKHVEAQKIDSVNYVIYSTIILNNIPEDARSVLVFNETSKDDYHNPWAGDTVNRQQIIFNWVRFFQTPFDSYTYSLYRDFEKKGFAYRKLDSLFVLPIKINIADKEAVKKNFKRSGKWSWKKFYEKYPGSGGIFEFSDVHFSNDKSKAIVYYSVNRNDMHKASLVIFQKLKDEWLMIQEGDLWQK